MKSESENTDLLGKRIDIQYQVQFTSTRKSCGRINAIKVSNIDRHIAIISSIRYF